MSQKLRITWVTHLAMADVRQHCQLPAMPSGGWLETYKEQLRAEASVSLSIICVEKSSVDWLETYELNGVTYWLILAKGKNYYGRFTQSYIQNINNALRESRPNLIHLHGTEFAIALALEKEWNEKVPVCISLQGLISVISARYFMGGVHLSQLKMLEWLPLFWQHHKAIQRGIWEKKLISQNRYFFGRTTWDYSHLKTIQPTASYYHLAEPIRKEFSTDSGWQLDKAGAHDIFCAGGCRIPIKGFHVVVEATAKLLGNYPDIRLIVTGISPLGKWGVKTQCGYARYISRLIREKHLENNIVFTGQLTASQMATQFSRSRCYVMASCIENSPNTLLEAMYIGTPIICALAGGIQDFVIHNESALIYRFEEVEMLATYITRLFEDDQLCQKLSSGAKKAIIECQKDSKLYEKYLSIIQDFKSNENHLH